MSNIKSRHLAFVAATLVIGGCASDSNNGMGNIKVKADMGQCSGVNSCKGTGSCATASSSCAGQNSCKGQGWLPLTKSDCKTRGGTFAHFKK